MTIRKGEPWGEAVESPASLLIADTDQAAQVWVVAARTVDSPLPSIGFAGGDLARTMGGGAPGRFPGTVTKAPVDLVRVEADGAVTWAIAHVVARRRWWRGEVWMAMNAQFFGRYDVAPRAHPNDGKLDLLQVARTMPVRTRLQARARARTGTHLPHPQLATRRVAAATLEFDRPLDLWVDGAQWRRADRVQLTVEPDALTAYA
ncbi:MAG TPA: hypothetical protein PLV13_06260 [Ilumatobacteraceae bacterium]|nr:hypothetical protein [Ilumatobacteraceae bacterium]